MQNASRYEKLGFKVVLEREWLDLSVNLMLQRKPVKEIRETLQHIISSSGKRSELTTKFTVQILRAWFDPDDDLVIFRDQLLDHIQKMPQEQWAILHWACLTASYPFLLSFSTVFGRLISLQNETTKAQVLARLQDVYGTREAVERSLYYAMGSFINLGLIQRKDNSLLTAPEKIEIDSDRLGILLWKAMIHATRGNRLAVGVLRNALALYAFNMPEIFVVQKYEGIPDLLYHQYASEEILALN